MKKTLVIGASENTSRYSNMAISKLIANGLPVVALGSKKGSVQHVKIDTERVDYHDIDTVTLYINPSRQPEYYDYIFSLKPKRIIFNPGTENKDLYELAREKGILAIEACTLVLLSTGQY